MSPSQIVQRFLDEIAARAHPDFKNLLCGISEHFTIYGNLSKKQRASVYTSASRLKIPVPPELELFKKIESEAHDVYMIPDQEPESHEHVLRELFLTIAQACNIAANKL